MSTPVKVTVTGIHKHTGVSKEQTTQTTASGTYRKDGNVHVVEYEEYMDEEGTGAEAFKGGVATYNLVRLTDQEMTVIRKGSVESELRFSTGAEHDSEYKTAFGAMKTHIKTKRYSFYTLEKGKRLIAEAEYTVSMNGMEMSETLMRFDITLQGTD